jgi:DNA-binding transcriptional MerR regulator
MIIPDAMPSAETPTYSTAAFAALAGVTPRALRHYDRLGLLKPRRSEAGYRLYSERDLEALEAIVGLKFIGVPLKEIAAIRRRAKGPFAQVLRAQREALEAKRRSVTRAIAAVTAAEAALRSGAAPDTDLFRRIIEVMHMDKPHEEAVATYTAMLKAKATYLASLTTEQRADLKQRWMQLIADVRDAITDDPAGPRAQGLLDRWLVLLRELGRPGLTALPAGAIDLAFRNTTELRDEVWARRAEWMPPGAAEAAPASAEEALARVREQGESLVGSDVMEFIRRARAARG